MNSSLICLNGSKSAYMRHKSDLEFDNQFTIKYRLEVVFIPTWFVLGFPGNLISIYIWTRYSMHHMVSSLYLAVLAVVDCLFFGRHLIWHLQSIYNIHTIKNHVMCHLFPMINMVLQYLSPLLILGFTVERFISVCYPLYRRKLCTVERTKHIYFYHYKNFLDLTDDCVDIVSWLMSQYELQFNSSSAKQQLQTDWRYHFFNMFNLISESFIFIVIPFLILFLNIAVIVKLNQVHKFRRILTRNFSKKHEDRQLSATISLLSVSFFLIITSLPTSIVQMMKLDLTKDDTCLSDDEIRRDPAWKAYFLNKNIQVQIEMLSLTHYAANFYIYLCTCRQFREQFIRLFYQSKNVPKCNQFSHQSNMSRLTLKT